MGGEIVPGLRGGKARIEGTISATASGMSLECAWVVMHNDV
jgi:hypothetical protein